MDALQHKRNALIPRKFGVTMEFIRNLHMGCQQRLMWVKGHPEKRNADQSQWSRKDFGIYFADAAAERQYKLIWDVIKKKPATQPLSMRGLLDEVIPPGAWHLR